MRKPRTPNQDERSDLIVYVLRQTHGSMTNVYWIGDRDAARAMVDDATIAVFDGYASDGPGYVGKVMMVVWPAGPQQYEAFIWRGGDLVRVKQDTNLWPNAEATDSENG